MKDLKFLKQNLIAHRGIHINEPENSTKAIKEAIKKNYTVEFDVHLLKDGTIVVFHDDNLKRMTGINKKLKDCTYEEIKNIKLLNTNNHIPTLKEILKEVDGKVPIIVELKYDRRVGKLEKELVKILDNYKGKFCIMSFNPLSIRWFKKHKPEYIRGLLISHKTKKKRFLSNKIMIFLSKPDFISCNYKLYKNKKIKKQMKKIPVIAWTIKNDKNYEKFKDKFDNLTIDVYKE